MSDNIDQSIFYPYPTNITITPPAEPISEPASGDEVPTNSNTQESTQVQELLAYMEHFLTKCDTAMRLAGAMKFALEGQQQAVIEPRAENRAMPVIAQTESETGNEETPHDGINYFIIDEYARHMREQRRAYTRSYAGILPTLEIVFTQPQAASRH